MQITNLDDNNIRIFLNNPVTSKKVKDGLNNAMKLRRAMAKTQREIGELAAAAQGHHRRSGAAAGQPEGDAGDGGGVQALPSEVRRAGDADREVPGDIKKLQGVEHQQRKDFDDFLANFSAE